MGLLIHQKLVCLRTQHYYAIFNFVKNEDPYSLFLLTPTGYSDILIFGGV